MKRRSGFVSLVLGIGVTVGCLAATIFLCGPFSINLIRHTILENPEFLRPAVGELDITQHQNLGDTLLLYNQLTIDREERVLNTFLLEGQDRITQRAADEFSFVDFEFFTIQSSRQGLNPYSPDIEFEFVTNEANPVFNNIQFHEGYIYAVPDAPGDRDYLVVLAPPDDEGLRLVSKYHIGRSILDLVIAGNYLYVGEFDTGIHIFDISDPTNLKLIAHHQEVEGLRYFNNLHIVGEYVYIVWQDIHVLDFSDPQQPFVVSRLGTYYNYFPSLGKFMVSGDKAYLEEVYKQSSNYLSVFDISDPGKPSYIKTYDLCVFCDGWTVIGENFYLLYSNNPYLAPSRNPEVLHLFDFSDVQSPQHIGDMQMAEGGWGMIPLPQDQLLMINYRDEEYGLFLYEYVP